MAGRQPQDFIPLFSDWAVAIHKIHFISRPLLGVASADVLPTRNGGPIALGDRPGSITWSGNRAWFRRTAVRNGA